VFITALLMAEPFEVTDPTPQIAVNSLDLTGWMVPPGWYGFVPAAGIGIIHRAGLDEDRGRAALELLGSPEVSSRSPEHDGRRLVRVDGGYLVLNFIKYREKDSTTAERSRRWRERQKAKNSETTATRDSDTATRDTTLKQKQKQKEEVHTTHNAHEAPLGSRREHAAHAMCGRVCLPGFILREFLNAKGGEEEAARAYVDTWAMGLIRAIAPGGPREAEVIGDPLKWWRYQWEAGHKTAKPDGKQAKCSGRLPSTSDAYGWCEHEPRCGTVAGHDLKLAREAREVSA